MQVSEAIRNRRLLALKLFETGMEIQHQKLSKESQMYPEEDVTLFQALLSEQANQSLYHFLILDKKGENEEYFDS